MTSATYRIALVAALLCGALVLTCGVAMADPPAPDQQPGEHVQQRGTGDQQQGQDFGDRCKPGVPVLDTIAAGACDAVHAGASALTGAAGSVGSAVAGSVLDQLRSWMTDAAAKITGAIGKAIGATTTPELQAAWYQERFASMAALGLGLSALVAMLALASAALRRDPEALAATVVGMVRAGLGTGLVLALTALALGVADAIGTTFADAAVGRDASQFWTGVGHAWGTSGLAVLGSSALTFFFALVQVVAAVAVWIELQLRAAAIYVATLFMPAALAASIWPPLRSWQSRLTRVQFMLIALKPVVLIVLSLAGSAAVAGLSGDAQHPVGVVLSAIVIFALAAWAPWVLMHLVSVDHEAAWSARASSEGASAAVATGSQRVGGALRGMSGTGGRSARGQGHAAPSASPATGGGPSATGGAPGGPGSSSSGGGGAAAGGSEAAGGVGSAGAAAGAGAGAGAVAAAAGMTWRAGSATAGRAGETTAGAAGRGEGERSRAGGETVVPARRPGEGGQAHGGGSQSGGQAGASSGQASGPRPVSRPVAPSPRTGQRPGGGRRGGAPRGE